MLLRDLRLTYGVGATTSCITVSTAGTYSVKITNANGCFSICNKTVTLYEAPVASTITASGATTFCAGGSVILSGNVGGVWNTGATTSSITVNTSGDYFVTNTTGCGTAISNHIAVIVNSLPVCNITGNGKICIGETTNLCAPAGFASYLWSTGATTNCISVSTAGTYSVTVTTVDGCSSTCSKIVTSYPAPISSVITAGGPITFCQGGSVVLSGNSGGTWSNGATTSTITVNTSGDYFVTSSTGCGTLISNHIIVTVNPMPVCDITGDSCICTGETVLICAPEGFAEYLWSTGQTTRCIHVSELGLKTVIVTNEFGCTSSCSIEITEGPYRLASDESLKSVDGNIEVKAYPNPFSNKAIIEFTNTESNSFVVIELYTLTENKVAILFQGDVEKGMLNTVEVEGEKLQAGIYIYRIINGSQIINRKLILVR